MDFVQRNLINERNNLQVELAKAKLLIAQLSEGKIMGKKPEQAPYGEKPKAEQGKNGKYEPKENPKPKSMSEEHDLSDPSLIYHSERRDGVTPDAATLRLRARERADHAKSMKDTEPKKLGIGTDGKKMTRAQTEVEDSRARYEQAEYISDLENVIVALAESMNMSVEELMELNARNMGRLAAMARQHNAGPSNMTGFRSGLKPLGGDIQPATNVGYRLAGMLGSAGVHGAAENMQGKVVASQRHPSGGYNQDSSVISDKTPVEFKNPDVKPDTMARAAAKVRDGSKGAQQDRARTAALKAAAAERASRTF